MCLLKKMLFFQVVLSVIIFSSCDSGNDNVYSGDEELSGDSASGSNDETNEYQERPDKDTKPGGGGQDWDFDYDQQDIENVDTETPDSSEVDEENGGIYAIDPDVAKCEEGAVNSSQKDMVLERINYIRSLHDLPPVVYNEEDDVYTANCALVIAANKQLSHTPGEDWTCYSEDAYTGCNKSNIYIQWGGDPLLFKSESVVDAFMTDEDVESLGHRRWLIDPWLAHISFGRVDDLGKSITGSAIKVINTDEQNISSSTIDYVAYPYEYYPQELYNDNVMMSFTVISDRLNKWKNNQVDFLTTAVTIRDSANKAVSVTGVKKDNDGYGVPNNIRWFASSIEPGMKYDVTITNVLVNSVPKTYTYWFELK